MKKYFSILLVILVVAVIFAVPAHAGVFSKVKDWISGEFLALIATAGVGILASVNKVLFGRIIKTITETGELLDTVGAALEDNKVSRDELIDIVKEAKDIVAVWKKK